MIENEVLQDFHQLVIPGSVKSSIVGAIKNDASETKDMLNLFKGTLIVRPLSHHTVNDGHKATDFFERFKTRTVEDFRNSASITSLGFDPVDLANQEPRGEGTVSNLIEDPASVFNSLHIW